MIRAVAKVALRFGCAKQSKNLKKVSNDYRMRIINVVHSAVMVHIRSSSQGTFSEINFLTKLPSWVELLQDVLRVCKDYTKSQFFKFTNVSLISYRKKRNTPTLIFENLKPVELSKDHFNIV